ncbi:MAG: hypothetical protein NTW60_00510 [Candidatus Wolfebacteria bacterium]|nr:hypothetical protein [Candidatus Wolfebacteria bacterium]
MEELQNDLKKLIEMIGFRDFSVNLEPESSRISVFFESNDYIKDNLPSIVASFNLLVKLMAKKRNPESIVFVDVNSYRKERENIILELARGAARKAAGTKTEITLPPMNAYERRLIHSELASRPDIKTESVGEGKERYVVVKPILE